jgi:hypothetical protein
MGDASQDQENDSLEGGNGGAAEAFPDDDR